MRKACATVNLPGNSGIEDVPYYWGRATIVNDHPDKVAHLRRQDGDASRPAVARGRR